MAGKEFEIYQEIDVERMSARGHCVGSWIRGKICLVIRNGVLGYRQVTSEMNLKIHAEGSL